MGISPHVCCSGQCLVLSDQFERTSGLGCDWEVRQGSWSISNNQLCEGGHAGARIITQRDANDLSFYVFAGIRSVVSGAIYRLIVNYKDDDNYLFVDVVYTSTTLTISLHRRVGGNEEAVKSRTWIEEGLIGEPNGIFTCLTDQNWTACAGVLEMALYQRCLGKLSPQLIPDGTRAGLGNGSSTPICYENFAFEETDRTHPDAGCPSCLPGCCVPFWCTLCDSFDSQPPVGWELHVSTTSDCGVMDGLEGTLYPGDPLYESWEGYITVGNWGLLHVFLFCDFDPDEDDPTQQCGQFWISADYLGGADCDWYDFGAYPDPCSCDPLELVYAGGSWYDGTDPECLEPCPNWDPITFTITCPSSSLRATLPLDGLGRLESDSTVKGDGSGAQRPLIRRSPPLRRRAWDLAQSLATFVEDGRRTVSLSQYQTRLEICDTCDQRSGSRCLQCGCGLALQARRRVFTCPLGKWPSLVTPSGEKGRN